jgi:hypothetical protein
MFHGPVNTEGAVAVARRFLVRRIICHYVSALLAIQRMAAKMAIPAIPHTPMGAKNRPSSRTNIVSVLKREDLHP